MNYLLDTHIFIWWMINDIRLSDAAKAILADSDNMLYLSAASLWEMRIKQQKGTLQHVPDILEELDRWQVHVVPIETVSALEAPLLVLSHSDPFDKMIFYHALQHNLILLTADSFLVEQTVYNVRVRKAH